MLAALAEGSFDFIGLSTRKLLIIMRINDDKKDVSDTFRVWNARRDRSRRAVKGSPYLLK